MRETHRAAIGTDDQVARLQSVVCAAHVAAALRVFALWMWGHLSFSLITIARAEVFRTWVFSNQAGRLYRQEG